MKTKTEYLKQNARAKARRKVSSVNLDAAHALTLERVGVSLTPLVRDFLEIYLLENWPREFKQARNELLEKLNEASK